jgi:hypothetical protein
MPCNHHTSRRTYPILTAGIPAVTRPHTYRVDSIPRFHLTAATHMIKTMPRGAATSHWHSLRARAHVGPRAQEPTRLDMCLLRADCRDTRVCPSCTHWETTSKRGHKTIHYPAMTRRALPRRRKYHKTSRLTRSKRCKRGCKLTQTPLSRTCKLLLFFSFFFSTAPPAENECK